MGYKDPDKQREYQRDWMRKRRETWFQKNGPCARCGSQVDLQIDHRNASEKVTHCVWSLSKTAREEELAKCQVLCKECHKKKTAESLDGQYKYGEASLSSIRALSEEGLTVRKIASLTGVSKSQVQRILSGEQRSIR